jgi:O-antigen/teichoic acid export membrane protein
MDAKPNMIKKYNKPFIGLALGMILPIISFLIYYFYMLMKTKDLGFIDFLETLKRTESFTAVLSICVLPNLLLFFLFKKLDYWYAIKGVIISVMIYTLLVVVLKFA